MTTEKSIVLHADEVRRLLAGEEVEIRRAVRMRGIDFIGLGGEGGEDWNDPAEWGFESEDAVWHVLDQGVGRSPFMRSILCPHGQAGEQRWVRECWAIRADIVGHSPVEVAWRADGDERHWYRVARPPMARWFAGESSGRWPWRSATHMPRWASRMTIAISAVRCERSAHGQRWEWVIKARRVAT